MQKKNSIANIQPRHSPESITGGGIHDSRIQYIDALKGLAILSVVLGHVANGYLNAGIYPETVKSQYILTNIVCSFQMPLFMMISGYMYSVAYCDQNGDPIRKRVRRQTGNLIIVYIMFSIRYSAIKIFCCRFVNSEISIKDVLLIAVKPIDMYWYLYVLIAFYVLFTLINTGNMNRWGMFAVLSGLAIVSDFIDFEWLCFPYILYFALFFFTGISYKKYSCWILGNYWFTAATFAAAVILSVVFWDQRRITDTEQLRFLNGIPVVNIIIGLGFSLALWWMFENIQLFAQNHFLGMLGRYSFEIYLIHCILTAGFRSILPHLGVTNGYISIAINCILSTSIPILFALLCKKMRIHSLLFKPLTFFQIHRSSPKG